MLDSRRLPARLDVRQTAILLGFLVEEISILMRVKCLRPLGEPAQNGHKYFSSAEVERLSRDVVWLDRATKAVSRARQKKREKGVTLNFGQN